MREGSAATRLNKQAVVYSVLKLPQFACQWDHTYTSVSLLAHTEHIWLDTGIPEFLTVGRRSGVTELKVTLIQAFRKRARKRPNFFLTMLAWWQPRWHLSASASSLEDT